MFCKLKLQEIPFSGNIEIEMKQYDKIWNRFVLSNAL